jgi:peptide/nickel transport system permease protein
MNSKLPRTAFWMLGFLLFLAVFRDVLANGRPLYCRIEGQTYWPGLRSVWTSENVPYQAEALRRLQNNVHALEAWKNPASYDSSPIYAPIPFSPGEKSSLHPGIFVPPGSTHPGLEAPFKHWLGTDAEGRDVAATVVSGARIALITGSLAMAVALLIGLSLGLLAGFWGDDGWKVTRGQLIFFFLGLPVAWFFAVTVRSHSLDTDKSGAAVATTVGVFLFIIFIFNAFGSFLERLSFFSKRISFPVDALVMRIAEVFSAIPRLILVIALAVALRGFTQESIWMMIVLMGGLGWTGVAKLVRAALLRERSLEYILAARGLGIPEWRVLLRHALPNVLRAVYISVAFGAAGAVLLESYLSFLGFGGPSWRGISWGSLFFNENSTANPLETWWITLFPGLMIFITVLSLNRVGEYLSEHP